MHISALRIPEEHYSDANFRERGVWHVELAQIRKSIYRAFYLVFFTRVLTFQNFCQGEHGLRLSEKAGRFRAAFETSAETVCGGMCVRERESVCVREREREGEREKERECVCVCVCVCEKE